MPVLDATALDSDPEGIALLRSLFDSEPRRARPRVDAFVRRVEPRASTPPHGAPPRGAAPLGDGTFERMVPVAALAPTT